MTLAVRLSKEAQADFVRLDGSIQVRVRKVLACLADFPNVTGAVPLRGNRAGRSRSLSRATGASSSIRVAGS